MAGRMQHSDSTQDSVAILQAKLRLKMAIPNSVGVVASSAHVAAKISNKQKVVVTSNSSSSSNEETDGENKIFYCTSCPRKFATQHALAGHRNLHRGEWEAAQLQETPDHVKMQTHKLPCFHEPSCFPDPTITLKLQSSGNSRSTMSNASCTIHTTPLRCAPQYPLANTADILKGPSACVHGNHPLVNATHSLKGPSPRHSLAKGSLTNPLKGPSPRYSLTKASLTNTLKGPSARHHLANPANTLRGPSDRHPLPNPTNALKGPSPSHPDTLVGPSLSAPRYFLAKPTNCLIGPSLGAAHHSLLPHANTLNKPSVWDPNNPLKIFAKPHGKSALGVRSESMIHKPCQGHLRQTNPCLRGGSTSFGRQQVMEGNKRRSGANIVDLKSLLTAAGSASTSKSEGQGSSEAHDLLSSSNRVMDHSSQCLLMQPDNSGENDSASVIDLELKL